MPREHVHKPPFNRFMPQPLRALLSPISRRVVAIAASAALALSVPAIVGCSGPGEQEAAPSTTSAQSTQTSGKGVALRAQLTRLLGAEGAQKLIDAAKSSAQVRWIITHLDRYEFNGEEMQGAILKLAASEPAAVPYVRGFPDKYPSTGLDADSEPSLGSRAEFSDVAATDVAHLYQWDSRWGYTVYGSYPLGLAGSAPTALAMCCASVDGARERTPFDLAQEAQRRDYIDDYGFTHGTFFPEMAVELRMACAQPYPSSYAITEALSEGAVLIADMTEGQLADEERYVVIAGIAGDGELIVNDPASAVNSSKLWDLDTVASEAVALYAFTPLSEEPPEASE